MWGLLIFSIIIIIIIFFMWQGVPASRLYESVYEQWLVGDLTMLEEPVLDHFVKDGAKFVGSHALQVITIHSWVSQTGRR